MPEELKPAAETIKGLAKQILDLELSHPMALAMARHLGQEIDHAASVGVREFLRRES